MHTPEQLRQTGMPYLERIILDVLLEANQKEIIPFDLLI